MSHPAAISRTMPARKALADFRSEPTGDASSALSDAAASMLLRFDLGAFGRPVRYAAAATRWIG